MPQVPFAASNYGRAEYGLPEAFLVNMLAEEGGPAYEQPRLPRPGMVSAYAWASAPVRGLFQNDGLFSGGVVALIGTALYKAGASAGTISGTDMARMAGSATQLAIVANGAAYSYDGTTLTTVTDGDLPVPIDVAFLGGRFFYAVQNSGRFYWSDTSDATSIDGLAFSNAESNPDYLVGLGVVGDELALFGSQTVEWWSLTGDDDQPVQRTGAKRYQRGCKSRDSIVALDNTLFWVGDDNIVYRAGNVPERISTNGIEARIKRASGALTAFSVYFEGHAVYVLNIPGEGSFGYDASNRNWAEWRSYGKATFRARCSVLVGGATLVGDDTTGAIWTLTAGTYADGSDPVSFEATAFFPVKSGRPRCNGVVLQGARGVGTVSGQGSAPITELRWSDDQGKTWCEWASGNPGALGAYGKPPRWNRLGLMKAPGRLFHIRTTDPVLATAGALLVAVDSSEHAWAM